MTDWITPLRRMLTAEYADSPPLCWMATVDPLGQPTVRTMVLRELRPSDGALIFTSDRRTHKDDHLRANPATEVAFWLAHNACQIRISGDAMVLDAENDEYMRQEWWQKISDESRALHVYHRNHPATAEAPARPARVDADTPMPPTFELIVLNPNSVELLNLGSMPHERVHYQRHAGQWTVEKPAH
ncbi:MAG TPA: pyridoxamine 5'-phosphate oxidase family protein [Tepidisphaeraceae bacterium]|nr:pyridoxamine 5'-phosphate oxidase family protein [Tepidisphaeraceae bacterium]